MVRVTLLAAAAACALGGCGTLSNVGPGDCGAHSPKKVYGGVREDAAAVVEYGQKVGGASNPGEAASTAALGLYFLAVDMPLSAVGDTLTLPWTIAASCRPDPEPEKPGARSGAAAGTGLGNARAQDLPGVTRY